MLGGSMHKLFYGFCSAMLAGFSVVSTALASSNGVQFLPICVIGCDDSSQHAYATFGGVNYEELYLELDINQLNPSPAVYAMVPQMSAGGHFLFYDLDWTDGTVTFDPGNGLAPSIQVCYFCRYSLGSASWAIDLSVPGVFNPTITADVTGYWRWKDGYGSVFDIPYSDTFSWSDTLTVPGAPGPELGAGIPGVFMAAGLFGWWRRRANRTR